MNWRAEEDFLAQREEDRNARITRALIGSMKPPDDGIIKNLQESERDWVLLLGDAGTAEAR